MSEMKAKKPFLEPWVTHDAKAWMNKNLKKHHEGFEYGAGCSTAYLGNKTSFVVSVEHRLQWYSIVRKLLLKNNIRNVHLIYEPDIRQYYKCLTWFKPETLDYVFNDGIQESRLGTTRGSWPLLKKGGFMIFDNSDVPANKPCLRFLDKTGARRIDFPGQGRNPYNGITRDKVFQTSVWIKP